MGKHKKWALEQKSKIVKEFKNGATISYLNNKYEISGMGTVCRWNQEYDKGILAKDDWGKKKYNQELEDIDILKNLMLFWWKYALSNTNRKISNYR